jgi:hypothetical protein
MKLSTTLGGIAGACALTLINQGIRKIDKSAPGSDLLRMNALAKVTKPRLQVLPVLNRIFPLALGGDMVSSSLYYAMAKGKTYEQTMLRGALLGLGAGLGAVMVPRFATGERPGHRTTGAKLLTVAWYVIGGLVAATAINWLESKENKAVPAA